MQTKRGQAISVYAPEHSKFKKVVRVLSLVQARWQRFEVVAGSRVRWPEKVT
jgi:hypothetical protein